MIEGSLEVKLPTIWTVGNAEVGRVREEKKEVRRSEKKGIAIDKGSLEIDFWVLEYLLSG